tara:strand:- start:1676 stop:1993 length:318 start_codon:yes stop_codon:yes gene_type:complete
MFIKEEKKSLTRLAVLAIGWGLGLDRFYEGRTKDGILSILGWAIVFGSLMLLSPCQGYNYVDGVKDYANVDVNPLIILPLGLGIYGATLVIRKGFRLLRSFEAAE